jgi:hypothetical protein
MHSLTKLVCHVELCLPFMLNTAVDCNH